MPEKESMLSATRHNHPEWRRLFFHAGVKDIQMISENKNTPLLEKVRTFWDKASCGEIYSKEAEHLKEKYEIQSSVRYQLEPYIAEFACFNCVKDRDVLEIGVGMGADHHRLASALPRSLHGIDLTPRAIEHTSARFKISGLSSILEVSDAERLHFEDESFDHIYSWGVIHHTPNTQEACNEIWRVLRRGGIAKIMIYHKYSIVGFLLWIRYALLTGHPFRSLPYIYHHYLESPGTKAYTVSEAKEMFSKFEVVETRVILSFGELLLGEVGQRHNGLMLKIAKMFWPRSVIKVIARKFNLGLYLLITATK